MTRLSYDFKKRNYSGIVDFSRDEETVSKRVESPLAESPSSDAGLAEAEAEPVPSSISLSEPTYVAAVTSVTETIVPVTASILTTSETKRRETRREDVLNIYCCLRSYPRNGSTLLLIELRARLCLERNDTHRVSIKIVDHC